MLRNEQDSEKKKAQEKRDKESSSRDSETTRAQEKWSRRDNQQKSRDHTSIIEDCEQNQLSSQRHSSRETSEERKRKEIRIMSLRDQEKDKNRLFNVQQW